MLESELERVIFHDIKTPLTTLLSGVEMLDEGLLGELTADQKNCFGNIYIGAKKLASLFSDLQIIRAIEDRRWMAKPETFTVQELLADFSWLLEYAKKEQSKIVVNLPDNLTLVSGRELIAKTLTNLLINAVKQKHGSEEIDLNIIRTSQGVRFEVTDGGVGIPAELLNLIYDRTFKLEHQDLQVYIGSGLSFYFCKLAIAELGGSLGAELVNEGRIRFYFDLPESIIASR